MAYEPPEVLAEPVYVTGASRRIYAYRAADGSIPALSALAGQDRQVRERYGVKFKQMGDYGQLDGKLYHPWNHEKRTKGMSAFKDNASQTRIPTFADGQGNLILTHLITGKKEDQIKPKDINEALRIRAEYQARKASLPGRGKTGRKRARR